MALLRLRGVEVAYGGRPALGPLDLSIQPGESLALVGPSGCGKSTALRLIAGLEAPTRGAREADLTGPAIGMVFQSPTLAPWLDARANVALPLILSGAARRPAGDQAEAALAQVGLAQAARLHPHQLSGGMAMRVALARALIARPRLLLLDEPFAALDGLTRRALMDQVQALQAETACALVFVSHDLEDACYMADRVLVLTSGPGRLQAEVAVPAPRPRPDGFRGSEPFLGAVAAVEAAARQGWRAAP
ncbi:ABC transporter ATP-binding protein [Brevundimonas sp. 2R-24]|uniref:ABC transporter ATP-binding protein n=1 Tax=Peiella sedimenti TaxID=3061083 RepID=A0ABT8SHU2_9CAUL|nr:ABC transporter ATP-binding protein [Caulobacteraceae bacterium XZ-24]